MTHFKICRRCNSPYRTEGKYSKVCDECYKSPKLPRVVCMNCGNEVIKRKKDIFIHMEKCLK